MARFACKIIDGKIIRGLWSLSANEINNNRSTYCEQLTADVVSSSFRTFLNANVQAPTYGVIGVGTFFPRFFRAHLLLVVQFRRQPSVGFDIELRSRLLPRLPPSEKVLRAYRLGRGSANFSKLGDVLR
jgi:hypothetical protein